MPNVEFEPERTLVNRFYWPVFHLHEAGAGFSLHVKIRALDELIDELGDRFLLLRPLVKLQVRVAREAGSVPRLTVDPTLRQAGAEHAPADVAAKAGEAAEAALRVGSRPPGQGEGPLPWEIRRNLIRFA